MTQLSLPYIISPTIWRIAAHSPIVEIFFTMFSTHAFWTCQRKRKILAFGHTSLHMQKTIRIHKIYLMKYKMKHMVEINKYISVLIFAWALSTMMDEGDQFYLILATLLWSAWRTCMRSCSWVREENHMYVIPPIVKNHNRVYWILLQTSTSPYKINKHNNRML